MKSRITIFSPSISKYSVNEIVLDEIYRNMCGMKCYALTAIFQLEDFDRFCYKHLLSQIHMPHVNVGHSKRRTLIFSMRKQDEISSLLCKFI